MKDYSKYTMEQLVCECIRLESDYKTLYMRLAAVKTILSNIDPICFDKLKLLINEHSGKEGDT